MAKYGENNMGKAKGGNSRPAKSTNSGTSSGLRMSNERRSDVTKAVSNKNPYPKGMC
jgi:hypothetical protein